MDTDLQNKLVILDTQFEDSLRGLLLEYAA